MDRHTGQPLRKEEGRLIYQTFGVDAGFEILLRRSDLDLKVQRSQGARLERGSREGGSENGKDIWGYRDVGVSVADQVKQRTNDVQMERVRATARDESKIDLV